MTAAFDTPIEERDGALVGPWRSPRQMLAAQSYDGHASIHDEATAQGLGFRGATIEGPTHFSQFAPLCVALWGERWFAEGCLSAHYRNPVFEGERVRTFLARPAEGATQSAIRMEREDGSEILAGTASIGTGNPPSALEARLAALPPLAEPVILRDVRVGMASPRIPVRMDADAAMGELYPFSLVDKLRLITEPSPRYEGEGAIIPFEMVSVLLNHVARADHFPAHGPAVGLFADQEIRLIDGPLRVATDYEIVREVVALSGSRRTESLWVKTSVYAPGSDRLLATMLLNSAILKDSYAPYAKEHRALYPG